MKKQNKIYLGIGIIVVVLIAIILIIVDQQPEKENTVKLGIIIPTSGSALASRGVDSLNSLNLAVKEINKNGGINGKALALVMEDNQGNNANAVTIVNKLLMDKDIDIFFSLFTGPTKAIQPLISENNKLLIYQSTVFDMAKDKNSFTCVDYWDIEKVGENFAKVAFNENSKKIGLLRSNTDSGQALENSFVKKAKELGLNYVIEKFQISDLDVRTQLTKFKGLGVDLLVTDGFENNYLNLFKGIDELKYQKNLKILGTTTVFDISKLNDPISNKILNEAKVIISYHDINNTAIDLDKFISNWKTAYNKHPTTEAIYSYDDIFILAESLKYCDINSNIKDVECIYNQLLSKSANVLEGKIEIDDSCIFKRNLKLLVFNQNKWENYE